MLQKLKEIARKAFIIKITANEDCIIKNNIVAEQLIKLQDECRQLLPYQQWHMVFVLFKNIKIALKQKAKAVANYIQLKNLLNADYSIEIIKREFHLMKVTQNVFKNYANELLQESYREEDNVPEEPGINVVKGGLEFFNSFVENYGNIDERSENKRSLVYKSFTFCGGHEKKVCFNS